MTRGPAIAAVCVAAGIACRSGVPQPAALDTKNDTCSSCRMTVSDQRLAAQIVAPGEEPRFFDDLGCLRKYLDEHEQPDAVVYVADHRTGEWMPATSAVYSRLARASTPMASGLIAHATVGSRSQDTGAAGTVPVGADIVLGSRMLAGRPQP
ncbi:MAG: nitrous oxide reductase accessory protein NosL [Acidobacteriia bacterium]|nr:nitrous oxide reductase accessory protein NosL [Terriglobia bacterium]